MASGRQLHGFGVAGFRSFESESLQRIGPLSKVHLLAGPNNAGKSNALAVAQRLLPKLSATGALGLEAQDRPASEDQQRPLRLAIALPLDESAMHTVVGGQHTAVPSHVWHLLSGPTFGPPSDDLVWFEYEPELDQPDRATNWKPSTQQIQDVVTSGSNPDQRQPRLENVVHALTHQVTSDQAVNGLRFLNYVSEALRIRASLPPVQTVGAFRQIAPGQNAATAATFTGTGLIERLARLQRPSYANLADRARFEQILQFVRSLLGDPEASIAVPQDAEDILLTHRGVTLPLSNYGAGVQQIIIIAAAATVLEDHLVCVEEPEIHLHPTMQRKLVRYLADETSNQYLVATHSAHFLDADRASISAVRLEGTATKVAQAVTAPEIAEISAELGFRASDLVQSNAAIWVEGPSDRIYVRHWLSMAAPEFVEGIHYSIMFYGGSLLNHLSPGDAGVDEFVALPRLNRNFAVVIDSDKTGSRKRINATKNRVKTEIDSAGPRSAAWVTSGYTIENYVPAEILQQAVSLAHPGTSCTWDGAQYVNPLAASSITGARRSVEKASVARRAVQIWPAGRWTSDLKTQTTRLAAIIRTANAH